MFWLWVIQIASDEQNISATSVIMKAGMRKRAMKKPLTSPTRTPTSSMVATAAAGAQGWLASRPPASVSMRAPERAAAEQQLVGGASHHHGAGDAGEPHGGAERQVDAGDDDDEGLADGDRQERPDVGELVGDVARLGEGGEEYGHRGEVGDGQVEHEVLGQQQAAQRPPDASVGDGSAGRNPPEVSLTIGPRTVRSDRLRRRGGRRPRRRRMRSGYRPLRTWQPQVLSPISAKLACDSAKPGSSLTAFGCVSPALIASRMPVSASSASR